MRVVGATAVQTSSMHLPSLNQLDPADTAEVALFADVLSISSEHLLEIVAKVGPMRPAIRFYAMRSVNERRRGKGRDKSSPPEVVKDQTSRTVPPHALFSGLSATA